MDVLTICIEPAREITYHLIMEDQSVRGLTSFAAPVAFHDRMNQIMSTYEIEEIHVHTHNADYASHYVDWIRRTYPEVTVDILGDKRD